MALIAISAKKQHGKDTVANIINYLTWVKENDSYKDVSYEELKDFGPYSDSKKPWEIKRFADKIKDVVCTIIGCNREQLEDEIFKNTPLDDEWTCYLLVNPTQPFDLGNHTLYATREEAEEALIPFNNPTKGFIKMEIRERPMTPRLMLQLIGTEGGRNLLHPNIWVNSLMSEYKPTLDFGHGYSMMWDAKFLKGDVHTGPDDQKYTAELPNWIIPDMRFPNELERVKRESGITIRVNRVGIDSTDEHESETALDNGTFDYVVTNDGSLQDLIEKVKEILIKEKII